MVRLVNRAERRSVLHSVRRLGCNCAPEIVAVPREMWPSAAVVSGHFVSHESGCPLGDRVLRLNAKGIVPSLFEHTARCAR